jgi:hypothetical protein
MGLFDRFSANKPTPEPENPVRGPAPEKPVTAGGVLPMLAAAREKLEAKDLPAALAIYEQVLTVAADRSDVLVTISADLGTTGHVREIVELLAPRYDVEKHGAAAGINLLQAYLATRNAEAAQHLLDLLFSLQRPELEARLFGFSRAISELFISEGEAAEVTGSEESKVGLVSISKPIWSYGLEAWHERILPRAEGRRRRVAFAQLALPGMPDVLERAARIEDDQGRLTRAFALWLAETFFYSAGYESIAAVGLTGQEHFALFPVEWSAENLRQLNESAGTGLDYIVAGSLRAHHADYELGVRIWEVKKFRELKSFAVRYSPATANEALLKIHGQLRTYMEWTALPAGNGLAYAPPADPFAYLQALGASAALFLGEKKLLPAAQLRLETGPFVSAAQANPGEVRAQLALVTALQRLKALGAEPDEAALAQARAWLASDAATAAGVGPIEL